MRIRRVKPASHRPRSPIVRAIYTRPDAAVGDVRFLDYFVPQLLSPDATGQLSGVLSHDVWKHP